MNESLEFLLMPFVIHNILAVFTSLSAFSKKSSNFNFTKAMVSARWMDAEFKTHSISLE